MARLYDVENRNERGGTMALPDVPRRDSVDHGVRFGRGTAARRALTLGVAAALVFTAATYSAVPAQAKDPGPAASGTASLADKTKFYDSREDPAPAKVLQTRAAQ